jgi:hypothetical protein
MSVKNNIKREAVITGVACKKEVKLTNAIEE